MPEVTLVAVRVVVTEPGIRGALTDAMLASMAGNVPDPTSMKSAAGVSKVRAASAARSIRRRPEPLSNGSAGVARSSLVMAVVAVVLSADRTCPGVQSGWRSISSAAAPATWGDAIEVPAMAMYRLPGGPRAGSSGTGVFPARIWRPGAAMSGFSQSPAGPRDEERDDRVALARAGGTGREAGRGAGVGDQEGQEGVGLGLLQVHGGQPVVVGHGLELEGLTSSMPAAPPWKTLKPRSTRPGPRSQTTILPANSPAGAGTRQPTLL